MTLSDMSATRKIFFLLLCLAVCAGMTSCRRKLEKARENIRVEAVERVGMPCLMNVYAIVTYHRPWTEFFSQIGYVIVISSGIYAVQWIVRLIVLAVIRIFRSLSR